MNNDAIFMQDDNNLNWKGDQMTQDQDCSPRKRKKKYTRAEGPQPETIFGVRHITKGTFPRAAITPPPFSTQRKGKEEGKGKGKAL